jgi:hypothetical protein
MIDLKNSAFATNLLAAFEARWAEAESLSL